MIKFFLNSAWRNLIKNKVSSTINILGLSIGIVSCLIIYLITHFEFSYDNFHPYRNRIYRIVRDYQTNNAEINHFGTINSPTPNAIRANLTGFENVAAFHNYYSRVSIPDGNTILRKFDMPIDGREVSGIIVTEPQYFSIFKYEWIAGNASSLNEPFKVVLSESQAHKYFGLIPPSEMIGKVIIYSDSLNVSVSGVVKDWNKNTDFPFTDFISLATVRSSFLKNEIHLDNSGRNSRFSQCFVKLSEGISKKQVESQFSKFVNNHKLEVGVDDGDKVQLKLQPLSDIHFNELYPDQNSRQAHLSTLYGLIILAAFILLIAVINFVNLSTALSLKRAKEIGIRKVLGSTKSNIVAQFLSETFFLALFAVLLSILLANPILAAFHQYIPVKVSFSLWDPQTILFLIGILFFTTIISGIYPGKILSSYIPALILKGMVNINFNHTDRLRKGLMIFQFIVSLIFIISTIVIGDQINYLQNKNLGFSKNAIINIPTSGKYQYPNYPGDKRALLADRLRQIPGVELVSVCRDELASTNHEETTIIKRSGKIDIELQSLFLKADENFIPLYQLKLIAGRNLLKSDTIKEFIINQTCAVALGYKKPEDAVGQFMSTGIYQAGNKKICPIVGVVADFHCQPLRDKIVPTFIAATNKLIAGTIAVRFSSNESSFNKFSDKLNKIENAWKEVYPSEKFAYSFFEDDIARFYENEQKTAGIINAAMIVAIVISCMGLLGLIVFTTKRRTKEIGIRKVLGASVSSILSLLSLELLELLIISLTIASPFAYFLLTKWLENYAYRIKISLWVFVCAGVIVLFISLITISTQVIKLAISKPIKSLRTE